MWNKEEIIFKGYTRMNLEEHKIIQNLLEKKYSFLRDCQAS